MKHFLFIIGILVTFPFNNIHGQNKLAESRQSSEEVWVYKLNAEDLRTLYIQKEKVGEKFLHTLVTKYRDRNKIPELPRGNYLLVLAVGNKLIYNAHTVDDLLYYFVNDNHLRLHLTTRAGKPITDARVRVGKRRMDYDPEQALYTDGKISRKRIIEIEHDGVYHYIELQPYQKAVMRPKNNDSFFKRIFTPEKPGLSGNNLFITDKPKYRPGDTVRWSARVSSRRGVPKGQSLNLWLKGTSIKDILLATITPEYKGVYHGELPLTRKLNLRLDRNYNLSLENKNRKKIFAQTSFAYEEYELNGLRLTLQSDREEHRRENPPTLTLKATDENGMAMLEGRYELTITRSGNLQWEDSNGFVPNILWEKSIDITSAQAEEITLPDSIFPQNVSFSYQIEGKYISPDNTIKTSRIYLHYDSRPSFIQIEKIDSGIRISQVSGGQADTVTGEIVAYTQTGEEIQRRKVTLPADYRLPGNASYLTIRGTKAEKIYFLFEYQKKLISHQFYRAGDSLYLQVNNPCEYPFWYQLRKGRRILLEGYATHLKWQSKEKGYDNYYFKLNYLFGGISRNIQDQLIVRKKNIQVDVKTPQLVYPGQKAQVEVTLSDYKGKPLRNADLTARGLTSKFHNGMTFVPYWGKPIKDEYRYLQLLDNYFLINAQSTRLNWERWNKEMGLDSIAYYQFLHPTPLYVYSSPAPEGITQIAPYAVEEGDLVPIYYILANGEPVYYYGTQHVPVYSFPVQGKNISIEMRLADRKVNIENIKPKNGQINIFAFDVSRSFPEQGITVTPLTKEERGKLSQEEREFLNKYLLCINLPNTPSSYRNFGSNIYPIHFLRSGQRSYLLSGPALTGKAPYKGGFPPKAEMLTGPFPEIGNVSYYQGSRFIRDFEPECGYEYTIRKDYVRLKSYPLDRIAKELPQLKIQPIFNDHTPSLDEVIKKRKQILIEYLKQLQYYPEIVQRRFPEQVNGNEERGDLEITLNSQRDSAALLFTLAFNKDRSTRWTFIPKQRTFRELPAGKSELIFVLDNFSYTRMPVNLQANGVNHIVLDTLVTEKDSVFSEWLRRYLYTEIFQEEYSRPVQATSQTTHETQASGQVIAAFDGEVLPGCSVLLKGTPRATRTDDNGRFKLRNTRAGDTLVFHHIGYDKQEVRFVPGNNYIIYLENIKPKLKKEEENNLDFYAEEENFSTRFYCRSTDSPRIVGQMNSIPILARPTIPIKPATSASAPPFIILNGKPYTGTFEDIDQSSITSIKHINPEEGKALYGAQGANGVIIVTTSSIAEDTEPGNTLRQNFSDVAFWQPHLRTDKEGKASFEVTYPDDITSWDTRFIAFGKGRRSGSLELLVKSFKSLTARLSMPRFAIDGDSLNAIGRLNNYQNDTTVITRTILFGNEIWKKDSTLIRKKDFTLTTSIVDTIPFIVPSVNGFEVTYSLKRADGFFDGEKRSIPVFRPGCKESDGTFCRLKTDSVYTFSFDSLPGKITVRAENSALGLLLQEVEEIEKYPYDCNEQIASKLKALLVKEQIYQALQRSFYDKGKIQKYIRQLTDNQNSEGLWGWWKKQKSVLWVSEQVIEALMAAKEAGYPVPFDQDKAIRKLLTYLRQQYTPDTLEMNRYKTAWLTSLRMLQLLQAQVDYDKFIEVADSLFSGYNLQERLSLLELKQMAGIPISVDSVMKHSLHSLLGGLYWEEPTKLDIYVPYRNNLQQTLTAYRILRNIDGQENALEAIQNYCFEQRGFRGWGNTYNASRIVETLLPDVVKDNGSELQTTRIRVNGKTVEKFPFIHEYPARTRIEAQQESGSPVFFTTYRTYWNPTPEKRGTDFRVKTHFIQGKDTLETLQAGQAVDLEVVVEVSGEANFVMIEVPIPAGCTYASKVQDYFGGIHREYLKEKTVICCTQLQRGTHKFRIPLLPRFTGSYHLNPARAELMYFPTVYGQESMNKVNIK